MPEQFKYAYRVQALNLVAGLTDFELPLQGEKIVYASPTNGPEITVRLQALSNDGIPLRPQGEIVAPFTRLYISAEAVAKTVYLLVAGPKDIQLTGRDVAISGAIQANIAQGPLSYLNGLGQLYERGHYQTVASGGYYMQLKNPSGSGKTIELLFVELDANVSLAVNYGRLNTDLGTLSGAGRSHQLGAPNGVGQVRHNAVSGGFDDMWGTFHHLGFSPRKLAGSITLDPGEGFAVQWNSGAAYNPSTRWVWREF